MNTIIDKNSTTKVYIIKVIIFLIDIRLKLLLSTLLIIVKALSNGSNSHIVLNTLPTISFGKYIPLVKHTSCTITLPTPPLAFSLTKLPINIPKAINSIDISKDTNIVNIILKLNFNPRSTATIKNNISPPLNRRNNNIKGFTVLY